MVLSLIPTLSLAQRLQRHAAVAREYVFQLRIHLAHFLQRLITAGSARRTTLTSTRSSATACTRSAKLNGRFLG